jgi:hypothetical protein
MAREDRHDRNRAGDYVADLKQRAEGPAPKQRSRLIEADSATRKTYPLCAGLLDYFPDALAEVARVSFLGNAKHNLGEPMHHVRAKSMDHGDCIVRHLIERGGFDNVTIDGVQHRIRHSGSLTGGRWRCCKIEREQGLPPPRAARVTA